MKPRMPFLEPRRPPYSLTRVPFEKCLYKPPKGILSEVNTGDPYMYMKVHLDGQEEVVYHVNLIDILDRVFLHDGMKFLSRDQERFFTRFIEAAGIIDSNFDRFNFGVIDEKEALDTLSCGIIDEKEEVSEVIECGIIDEEYTLSNTYYIKDLYNNFLF